MHDFLVDRGTQACRIPSIPLERGLRARVPRAPFGHGVQIRRLDYKRDSLQDIFLRAMEAEAPEVSRGGV